MRKVLSLFLTIIFVAGFMVVQGQELKTLHHFQGREDISGLTYTGYEDELGNIIRHGRFTYTQNTKSAILNYKNGKIDGEAVYTDTKTGMVCKIKYNDGRWSEINYRQDQYQRYKYNDSYYGKLSHGPIVLKCSRTESGLPTGDFELTFIAPYEHFSVKGEFDTAGQATGKWITEGYVSGANFTYCRFEDFRDTVYFEQGICLGDDEIGAGYGRNVIVEKNLTQQELRNKGFYFDIAPIYMDYEICNDGGRPNNHTMETMLSDNLSAIKQHIYYQSLDVSDKITTIGDLRDGNYVLGDLDDVDFSHILNYLIMRGSSITYMSNDLYQSVVNRLKNNNLQTSLKYDNQLDKYYVLKADGESRLYIPIEYEDEFKKIIGDNHTSCGEVTDYDGYIYETVQIGTQCWMKENLRTNHYADGTEVAEWTFPNTAIYGWLYTWSAIMHGANSSSISPSLVQGICPDGWHIPSVDEWKLLTDYVSSQSDYVCGNDNLNIAKALASRGDCWNESYYGGACCVGHDLLTNNATGFSALPGGLADGGQNSNAFFWSSTEIDDDNAWLLKISYDESRISKRQGEKNFFLSVRCLKD